MPDWVNSGYLDYARRMPGEASLKLIEISPGHRGKNADIQRAIRKESDQILAAIEPRDRVIALEVKGESWSTEKLAEQFGHWKMSGGDVALLVGGPEGLSSECRQRADQQWSLSALTLPHPLVRVLVAEQLYRAWAITQNHPYHR
jgi:23S rRNA (pseudouridine1915-N3)-methyltransferase